MTIAASCSEALGTRIRAAENRTPQATSTPSAAADAELVRRFKAGENASFDKIYARHYGRIHAAAISLVSDRADVDDVVQMAFIRAYRALPSFRGESSLSTWLHRILANVAHNHYWYCVRRRRFATFSIDLPIAPDGRATHAEVIPDDAPGPVRESEMNEFGPLVDRCMARLNARDHEVLVRRNLLHESYDTIARGLRIEAGTVKSRIARARDHLRLELSHECREVSPRSTPEDWFEPCRVAARTKRERAEDGH